MYKVKSFFKGEMIFKENSAGENAYIIKEGKVEISKNFGDKSVVLEVLGQGEIFGEMALVSSGKRTASALAIEPCELIEVEKDLFNELMTSSPKIIQMLTKSLIARLKKTSSRVKVEASDDLFNSVCSLLDLLCRDSSNGDSRSLNLSDAMAKIKSVLSISRTELTNMIEKLSSMNLLVLEDRRREGKFISLVDAEGFLLKAKKAYQQFGNALSTPQMQHTELADINDLANFIGVAPEKIYKKIAYGELPESLFYFHKNEAFKWASDKGREFFERKGKRQFDPKKLEQMDDIVLMDDDSLRALLGKADAHKLCALIKYATEEVRGKIFSNLSGRMRKIIDEEVANLGEIEPDLLELYEEEFVELLKAHKASDPGRTVPTV